MKEEQVKAAVGRAKEEARAEAGGQLPLLTLAVPIALMVACAIVFKFGIQPREAEIFNAIFGNH